MSTVKEYLFTDSERAEFIDQMSRPDCVYALTILSYRFRLIFDQLAHEVGLERSREARAQILAEEREATP